MRPKLTQEQMAQRLARKLGRQCRLDMTKDLLQEIELAKVMGKDLVDAVKWAAKYERSGMQGHRSALIPTFVGGPREHEQPTANIEIAIANNEFIEKLWLRVSNSCRKAMAANLTGVPYVWRSEIKAELLKQAKELS